MNPHPLPPQELAAARTSIEHVLHRYAAMAVANADFDAMADLFAPDGVFVLRDGTKVPRTEVGRVVNGHEPTFIRHHVTTIDITFTGPDTAETVSYFLAVTDLACPDHWGYWQDSFARQPDGHWLLTSKRPVLDGMDPHGWVSTVLIPSLNA